MTDIDYRPPGAYTREGLAPSTPAPFFRPTCVAILGRVKEMFVSTLGEEIRYPTELPGDEDEWLWKANLVHDRLTADSETIEDRAATPNVYELDTDYELDYFTGEITSLTIPLPKNDDDTTWVVCDYDSLPLGFYEPRDFYDYDDLVDFYGDPLDDVGDIQSPLVLGSSFVLRRAPWVKAFPIDPALDDQENTVVDLEDWKDTIDQKLTLQDVDIVVTMTEFSRASYSNGEVLSFVEAMGGEEGHLAQMCSETGRMERIWIWSDMYGLDVFSTGDNYPDFGTSTTLHPWGVDKEEAVYICPPGVQWFNYRKVNPITGNRGTNIQLDGNYLAATCAGILAANTPQMPLTFRKTSEFSGLGDKYSTTEKNTLASKCATVVDEYNWGLRVRHGLTCNNDNLEGTEISVVRAKHYMCKYLRARLEESFVGQPMMSTTFLSIASMTYSMLILLRDAGVIYDFRNVKARANPNRPTEVVVKFEYCPAYPLNYIIIEFTINPQLLTSQTAEAAASQGLI